MIDHLCLYFVYLNDVFLLVLLNNITIVLIYLYVGNLAYCDINFTMIRECDNPYKNTLDALMAAFYFKILVYILTPICMYSSHPNRQLNHIETPLD